MGSILLLIYIIGYIGYIICNLKRIGKIESSIEIGGVVDYYKVTIWWLMIESIIWPVAFLMFVLPDIIRPYATQEEYKRQKIKEETCSYSLTEVANSW